MTVSSSKLFRKDANDNSPSRMYASDEEAFKVASEELSNMLEDTTGISDERKMTFIREWCRNGCSKSFRTRIATLANIACEVARIRREHAEQEAME